MNTRVDEGEATLALACELIRRRSVTPEDDGCQELLAARLSRLGFRCTHLPFGDTQNLWAQWGDAGPLLVFAGHTDVVPPGPLGEWASDPFEPSLRDGLLYGRGAADMKGSLAAMVTACETVLAGAAPAHGRIGFLITSDEEGAATDGTVRVMQWLQARGTVIDYCVVGEPSSGRALGDTIKNGRRGSLNGVLRLRGRQGHVAYPQHADNPIHRALPALAALAARHWDRGNAHFPPTTFQITNLHAGSGATNVIPGELELWLNFRFNTEQTPAALKAAVHAALDAQNIDHEVDWTLSGAPFLTPEGALVEAAREAVREVTGQAAQLSTSGGTSDGRFIAPGGAEVVELGPVNASIHRVNEHVAVEDLPRLAQIYAALITRLLGTG
jgi:succinyl-diaminopimelate desuccinylase